MAGQSWASGQVKRKITNLDKDIELEIGFRVLYKGINSLGPLLVEKLHEQGRALSVEIYGTSF